MHLYKPRYKPDPFMNCIPPPPTHKLPPLPPLPLPTSPVVTKYLNYTINFVNVYDLDLNHGCLNGSAPLKSKVVQ